MIFGRFFDVFFKTKRTKKNKNQNVKILKKHWPQQQNQGAAVITNKKKSTRKREKT